MNIASYSCLNCTRDQGQEKPAKRFYFITRRGTFSPQNRRQALTSSIILTNCEDLTGESAFTLQFICHKLMPPFNLIHFSLQAIV